MRTFLKAELYITGLQDAQGKSAIEGLKKTVFLGLPIRMNSVMATFDRLVETGKLQNLLTHKMSHNHLKAFFGCVKGKGCQKITTLLPSKGAA